MQNFTVFRCCHCSSVILYLPEDEARKMEGLTFLCDCCGYHNLLMDLNFIENTGENSISIFELLPHKLELR